MSSSVVRAAQILNLLSRSERPVTLTEICSALSIPKSTAFSILRDLTAEGFVDIRDRAAYTIGLKAFEVGAAHLRVSGRTALITPELSRLSRAVDMTVHYAVLDGVDVVYLCKEDPPGLGVRLASSVGARLPADLTAVGKSSLAWLEPEAVREHITADRANDEHNLALLHKELETVRLNGYATDDGATANGITCIAAPVFDGSGPRGAVGVSYLTDPTVDFANVAARVQDAAARTTLRLGGRSPQ